MLVWERYFSLFLLLLMSLFIYASLELSVVTKFGKVGPGFFPVIIVASTTAMIAAYMISLFGTGKNMVQHSGDAFAREDIGRQLYFLVLTLVSVALIDVLGILVSMVLFIAVVQITIEKATYFRAIGFAVSTIVLFYLVFEKALGLVLPYGIFTSVLK